MHKLGLLLVVGIIGCSSSYSPTQTTAGGGTSGGGGVTTGGSSGTTTGSSYQASATWKQDSKSYKAVPSCTSFSGSPFTGQVTLGETVVMSFHQITLETSTDAGLVVTGTGDCEERGANCVDLEWQNVTGDAGCQFTPADCDEEAGPCPIACLLNGSMFELHSDGQANGQTIVTGSFALSSNQCSIEQCGDTGSGSHTASGTFSCLW